MSNGKNHNDTVDEKFHRYRIQAATFASGSVVISSGLLTLALKEKLPVLVCQESFARVAWLLAAASIFIAVIIAILIPYYIFLGYLSEARKTVGQDSGNSNKAFSFADGLMPWLLGFFLTGIIVAFLVLVTDSVINPPFKPISQQNLK